MNIVILSGHVGRDPEVKRLENGTTVATFSLAVNEWVSGKEITTWQNITCWGKTAEIVEKHITKGVSVELYGKNRIREYEDKAGQKVKYHYVQADSVNRLGSKPEGQAETAPATKADEKDDLPF